MCMYYRGEHACYKEGEKGCKVRTWARNRHVIFRDDLRVTPSQFREARSFPSPPTNATTMSNVSSSLYGAPRPKNKPISLSSTSIHALSTELSLVRSQLSKTDKLTARRPSNSKKLFSHNKGVSARNAKDIHDGAFGKSIRELGGAVTDHDLERSRRKMEIKAKLYGKMKRGEMGPGGKHEKDGLVDFDRKWAEEGSDDDGDGEEEEEEGGGEELVEYQDEFGRTRMGTKAEVEREKSREQAAATAAKEISGDRSRPLPPSGIIYGNTIQTHAFETPEFSTVPKAADLAAALPTEEEEELDNETHYDASTEVRTKGVGFYQFSKDVRIRKEEMAQLEKEREKTERERVERTEKRKRKREELEKRREEIKNKKRGKIGGSWLEQEFGDLQAQ